MKEGYIQENNKRLWRENSEESFRKRNETQLV